MFVDTFEEANAYGNRRTKHRDTDSENDAAARKAFNRRHPLTQFADQDNNFNDQFDSVQGNKFTIWFKYQYQYQFICFSYACKHSQWHIEQAE